jgi:D-tyrosyl-tRNA(Tyr) deacylase
MRAVVQLVSQASVSVGSEITGAIKMGVVVLLGIDKSDKNSDADYLAEKIANLRIFPNQEKLMDKSLLDVKGEMLIVSQFTLLGDCRKGRRPSFSQAAPPDRAQDIYNHFVSKATKLGIKTATGVFQAMMQVSLTNSGPVTIIVESKKEK